MPDRPNVGEAGLGEFARSQLQAARRDPRLGRGREAMVADFWSAMEEAERVRMLGVLGLQELQHVLEREEQRLGVSHKSTDLPGEVARDLQAAWERAEMARLEIANGHPSLNAQALLSMSSALDALVEEFAPKMRELRRQALGEGMLRRVEERVTEAARDVEPEIRERVLEAVRPTLEKEATRLADTAESRLPKPEGLSGSGSGRYETVLAQAGLGAPEDRPVPEDLDQALTELGGIRNVLVHRAGRVDGRALGRAPSLRYQDGELVRVSSHDYRTYSAAVRCYAGEVIFRSMRGWPEVSDEDGPDLDRWRDYYRLGA